MRSFIICLTLAVPLLFTCASQNQQTDSSLATQEFPGISGQDTGGQNPSPPGEESSGEENPGETEPSENNPEGGGAITGTQTSGIGSGGKDGKFRINGRVEVSGLKPFLDQNCANSALILTGSNETVGMIFTTQEVPRCTIKFHNFPNIPVCVVSGYKTSVGGNTLDPNFLKVVFSAGEEELMKNFLTIVPTDGTVIKAQDIISYICMSGFEIKSIYQNKNLIKEISPQILDAISQ